MTINKDLFDPYVKCGAFVHIVSPIGGSEHTVCGIANDAWITENDSDLKWQSPDSFVDCPLCLRVMDLCLTLRKARKANGR